jgi:hypothetical protein
MTEIKHCLTKECRNVGTTIAAVMDEDTKKWYVECSNCGRRSPWGTTEDDAIRHWNGKLSVKLEILGITQEESK